ncbi:hypothetical protein Pelo_19518 [Pelomyxa schiedti]|nr:hypothetical protein Pelo_19518 [Pelomyxa schiedti]
MSEGDVVPPEGTTPTPPAVGSPGLVDLPDSVIVAIASYVVADAAYAAPSPPRAAPEATPSLSSTAAAGGATIDSSSTISTATGEIVSATLDNSIGGDHIIAALDGDGCSSAASPGMIGSDGIGAKDIAAEDTHKESG